MFNTGLQQVTAASTIYVAGVPMPTYALRPTIIKQETKDRCSAAVIQTVLKYMGATYPSQTTIMAAWGKSSAGAQYYPTFTQLKNYINARKPSSYTDYVLVVYAGNQYDFNTMLKFGVEHFQPMLLLMSNPTSSTANWPYKTDGHFSLCNGILTWDKNDYFIGDPYYFPGYGGITGSIGEHQKAWGKLNSVIKNKHGSGNQIVAY